MCLASLKLGLTNVCSISLLIATDTWCLLEVPNPSPGSTTRTGFHRDQDLKHDKHAARFPGLDPWRHCDEVVDTDDDDVGSFEQNLRPMMMRWKDGSWRNISTSVRLELEIPQILMLSIVITIVNYIGLLFLLCFNRRTHTLVFVSFSPLLIRDVTE